MKSVRPINIHRPSPTRWSPQTIAWFCLAGIMLTISIALRSGSPRALASAPYQAATPLYETPEWIATPAPAAQTRSAQISASVPVPRLENDAYTVALYHMDSVIGKSVPDATGNHYGVLFGNATIEGPGLFGNALKLDGRWGPGSYMRAYIPGGMSQGTFEAFIDFYWACGLPSDTFTLMSLGGDFRSGTQGVRLIEDAGRLNFEILSGGGWVVASSGINACRYLTGWEPPAGPVWPYERWRYHHVAGTWGPRGMEIWVDGVLHGISYPGYFWDTHVNPRYACIPQDQLASPIYPLCVTPRMGDTYPGVYTGGVPNDNTLLIGCDPDGNPQHCHGGKIDQVRISNIQRTFTPMYNPLPPSTPTRTPTPRRPDPYPDFGVSAIIAPVAATQATTQTIWINVANFANKPFNRAPVPIATPTFGQSNGMPRASVWPGNPRAYSDITSYFAFVELYVDTAKPASTTALGNCQAKDGTLNWAWIYNLGAGQVTSVPMDCWLAPGAHTFYAQVDSCDDPGGELCSPRYGYVLETDDTNNIYPASAPIQSGYNPFSFLPMIRAP